MRVKNAALSTRITELEKTVGALKRENSRLMGKTLGKDSDIDKSTTKRRLLATSNKPSGAAERSRADKENSDLNGSSLNTSHRMRAPPTVTKRIVGPTPRTAVLPPSLKLPDDTSFMLPDLEEGDGDDCELGTSVLPQEADTGLGGADVMADLADLSAIAPKAVRHEVEEEGDINDVTRDLHHFNAIGAADEIITGAVYD